MKTNVCEELGEMFLTSEIGGCEADDSELLNVTPFH